MDAFNKTIKKLSEEDYQFLLKQVSERKESKPYMVLEAARNHNYDDNQMIDKLQVNASTYYTLKSRLKTKIAGILSKQVENPISVLMDEVARVPANLFGNGKEVAIRALKDLEKQLLEYDLSNELIVVYKTLARLNLYNYDYEYYNKLYNKYVAYSLAVVKAENLFYDFVRKTGTYLLTKDDTDLENIKSVRRELSNICELYESHRLFVIYNIVSLYYQCLIPTDLDALKSKEIEVDNTLKEINDIFNKYSLDTFYQNYKFLVDALYFEYYCRTRNAVRADYYYKRIASSVPELANKHILNFNVINFLYAKLEMYLLTNDMNYLSALNQELEVNLDIDKEEIYHYTALMQYYAFCKFYEGDYSRAAKIINNLRNDISLRNYLHTDVQCKLFQAMQYCIMGDEELSMQLANSVKRQVSDMPEERKNIKIFLKLLAAAIKPGEYKKKIVKIGQLWARFQEANAEETPILAYLKLDEKVIKRMAEPYK